MLAVRDLTVDYRGAAGTLRAVDGLSFDLLPGRTLGIVGESGSGKSTVALAALGLHQPPVARVGGQVVVDGVDVVTAGPDQVRALRGARIAMVFQDPLSALDPFHTIGDQIAEVYRVHTGASRRAAMDRAVEVLDQVHIADPARRARAHPHEFSGGMRQRALIAMALACNPKILVADEPTTALDVTVQAQILDLLDEIRIRTGMALLLVSHDLGVVAGVADEIMVMRDGRVVEHGPVDAVLSAPAAAYTRELLAAAPRLDGPAAAPPVVDALPVVDDVPVVNDVLLRLENVSKRFPLPRSGLRRSAPVVAVDDVTLEVRRGETLGIVGESGSGKSTLARLMVRLLTPSSGHVSLDGVDIAHLPERRLRAVRHDLQMVFQDPVSSLNPRRTIGETVADPLRARLSGTEAHLRHRVAELLERVGLDPGDYDRYPHEFSGGMRQRVGIARALAARPRLVVCDEPVSSLDVSTQAQVLDLLSQVRREFDLTLVFISHDLAVVRQICDRVAVMRAGVVVESGAAEVIYARPQHPYTRDLLAAVPSADPVRARRRRDARAAQLTAPG